MFKATPSANQIVINDVIMAIGTFDPEMVIDHFEKRAHIVGPAQTSGVASGRALFYEPIAFALLIHFEGVITK